MVNHFSPASDRYPLVARAAVPSSSASVRSRYPSAPAGLRVLRAGFSALHRVAPELAFRAAWQLFTTPRSPAPKAWEVDALASARPAHVAFRTGALAVYEWGPATGPAVLLVHGWEHRATFWGRFAVAVAAAGYRVVAFDGPAHGTSPGRQTNLVDFATAVQTVVDWVGPVHAVVAHSFGAAATTALPTKFNGGGILPRLVLMAAPGSIRAVAERFAALLKLPSAVVTRMERHIRERFGRDPDGFSLVYAGPRLAVGRALLLHDRHDELVPFAEAETVAAAWPAVRFEPTTGLGHNQIMRDPGVIARVVAFLAD
ncbi:MAG: alpha/beta fold hydrolase [Hymenobacteraceae bacterium]|nr:alpha/beta fold hydrolase [Hymenobacteraceae bacterium]